MSPAVGPRLLRLVVVPSHASRRIKGTGWNLDYSTVITAAQPLFSCRRDRRAAALWCGRGNILWAAAPRLGTTRAGTVASPVRQLLPTPVEDVDPGRVYADPLRQGPDGRPWVVANMVASVDGRAAVEGRTAALSGAADRAVFNLLRTLADVVLVGAGTVRAERYGPVRNGAQPPIAVVSRSLDLDWSGSLFADAAQRTQILTCAGADPDRRARAAEVAEVIVAGEAQVDLGLALAELGARGRRVVLCEGGPHLLGELVVAGLVDELCFTLSPLLAGGVEPSLLAALPIHPPQRLGLASVIEDDGALLLRYLRSGSPPIPLR